MLNNFLALKERENSVKEFSEAVRQGIPSAIFGVNDPFKSYLVSVLEDKVLLVVKDFISAQLLGENIKDLSGKKVTIVRQKDEILFSPKAFSRESLYARISALYDLQTADVVIATAETLMQTFPEKIKSLTLNLHDEIYQEQVINQLVEMGYSRSETVEAQGTFSLRGDILEVYPVNGENPIRFDFFGDELENIKVFELDTREKITYLNEGEILFLSTSAVQEIKRADENDIAVNFIIKPQFFDKILEMLGEEETPLKNFVIGALTHKNTLSNYLHFKVSGIIPIQNLMENLIYTLVSDKIIKRNATAITMGLLFLELINHTDKLYTDKKTDSVLLEVFRYIDENYKDGSLNELATLLHYDFYSLSKEIKNLSGKTYTELLQEKRLSQAAFLLKHTELNVSDISVAVGYENISYFHRIFSAKFGFSPHKYRSCK